MAQKIVIVVSDELDVGQAANVVGLLGVSLGHHVTGIVGPAVEDADGWAHAGMSTVGLPVLATGEMSLRGLHQDSRQNPNVQVFDVTDAATRSRDYAEYTARLKNAAESWRTVGLALVGPRRDVDALTGRLGLLR
jgi:hypothetical protein